MVAPTGIEKIRNTAGVVGTLLFVASTLYSYYLPKDDNSFLARLLLSWTTLLQVALRLGWISSAKVPSIFSKSNEFILRGPANVFLIAVGFFVLAFNPIAWFMGGMFYSWKSLLFMTLILVAGLLLAFVLYSYAVKKIRANEGEGVELDSTDAAILMRKRDALEQYNRLISIFVVILSLLTIIIWRVYMGFIQFGLTLALCLAWGLVAFLPLSATLAGPTTSELKASDPEGGYVQAE